MTIEIGQIYEDMDPRHASEGKPARNIRIRGLFGGHVSAESYLVQNPYKRRRVRILKSRLLSKAYRLVQ